MQKEEKFSDDLAAYISGSLLQAGSDTTATILIGFVQAMVVFPDVAKKAQMELDRVCGDRMPDLNDVPNLPYIRACAKESLRWMPGFMLGIPHSVTQDDTYMGYHIPRGSTVMMNVWCVFAGKSCGNNLLLITSFLLDTGLYIMIPKDTQTPSSSIPCDT